MAAEYDFFGERYGWTPDIVDGLRAKLKDALPVIADVKREIIEAKQREASRGG